MDIITSEIVAQKFVSVLKPLLIQSQIFGLITFNYDRKKFEISKIRQVYNAILILIYILLILYCIYFIVTLENGPPIIYKTTDTLNLIVNACYVCIIWFLAIINQKKIIKLLLKLIEIDTNLYNNQIKINYEKNHKEIKFRLIIRFVIIIPLISFLLTHVILNISRHLIVAEYLSYCLIIINSVSCYQQTQLILIIKNRFKILNEQLYKIIIYFKKNINIIEKNHKNQFIILAKICTLHHNLTKLIKLFNKIFGIVLLLMFGVSFVVIVIALFYCAGQLQAKEIKLPKLFWAFCSCLSFILDTIYVCRVCYQTIQEANKAGDLIHQIESEDYDIRDEIEMFSLQIANEQVEFSAAGFFPIDFTLLFSIIGGVTTYIIILIQLAATLSDNDMN